MTVFLKDVQKCKQQKNTTQQRFQVHFQSKTTLKTDLDLNAGRRAWGVKKKAYHALSVAEKQKLFLLTQIM